MDLNLLVSGRLRRKTFIHFWPTAVDDCNSSKIPGEFNSSRRQFVLILSLNTAGGELLFPRVTSRFKDCLHANLREMRLQLTSYSSFVQVAVVQNSPARLMAKTRAKSFVQVFVIFKAKMSIKRMTGGDRQNAPQAANDWYD